jgi:hypothetical protein
VWGSEFTSKGAALQVDSAKFAPALNVQLWILTTGDEFSWNSRAQSPFESNWTFENNFESASKEPFS